MPDTEKPPSDSTLSKYLRPARFDTEPTSVSANLQWAHWSTSFKSFMGMEAASASEEVKLQILINHVAPPIFNLIRDCKKYSDAISILDKTYDKKKNIILSRHQLISRRQQPGESIAEFSRALTSLAHDCDFKEVSADEHRSEAIRGAFIAGVSAIKIRERLLEKSDVILEDALKVALSLETAENTSQALQLSTTSPSLNALPEATPDASLQNITASSRNNNPPRRRCFFCGGSIHQRLKCPARNSECQLCSRKGHYASVCRSSSRRPYGNHNAAISDDLPFQDSPAEPSPATSLATICAAAPASLMSSNEDNYYMENEIKTLDPLELIDLVLKEKELAVADPITRSREHSRNVRKVNHRIQPHDIIEDPMNGVITCSVDPTTTQDVSCERSRTTTTTTVAPVLMNGDDSEFLKGRKVWSRWSKWGACSVSCGTGSIVRRRVCLAGRCASGEREEQRRPCARPPCPHCPKPAGDGGDARTLDDLHDLD